MDKLSMNAKSRGRVPDTIVKGLLHLLLALGLGLVASCGGAPQTPPDLPERVFLVGVEMLSAPHLDLLLQSGELPNLKRLVDGGARVDLQTPLPLERTSLWTTALSGKMPSRHGVIGPFVNLPNGERTLPPSSARNSMLLWQMLGVNGVGTAVVGFPSTWPAETLRGFLVSEMAVPSRWNQTSELTFQRVPGFLETFPPNLYDEISPLIREVAQLPREEATRFFTLNEDEYRMLYDQPLGSQLRGENPPRDVALSLNADRSRLDIALHLADNYRPRFVAVYQDLLAAVQTTYWPFRYPEVFRTQPQFTRRFRNTVDEGYRDLDRQIGRILAQMTPRDVLVVVSDCGFDTVPPLEGTEARPTATTSPFATMVLFGPPIRSGVRIREARLADVAPTVLALFGAEIAEDMDGSPLTSVLTDAFSAAHPRRFRASYDETWDKSKRFPGVPTPSADAQ